MTSSSVLPLALGLTGAVNFGALSLGLLLNAGNRIRAARSLAVLAAISAGAAALISLDHARLLTGPLWQHLEVLITLGSGPAIVVAVRDLLGKEKTAASHRHAIAGWAALALLHVFVPGGIDIRWAVAIQMGFTVAALWIAVRENALRSGPTLLRRLLAAVLLVHAAQILRMATAPDPVFLHAVPIAMSVLAVMVVVHLFAGTGTAPLPQARRSTVAPDLLPEIARHITDAKLHLRADLSLAQVAKALNRPTAEISQAINEGTGMGFPAFVNRLRIGEAKQFLEDPGEAQTSIEAIGLFCGFKSRSAFYTAFKRETGITPAAYRSQTSNP